MISHEDIKNLVTEWDLREDIIEKDYVIGWVLSGIGSNQNTSQTWVFKGGTCLKKCFIETFRFSEDIDFTVLPKGPVRPEALKPILNDILSLVTEESGIDFSIKEIKIKQRESPLSMECRIYYRGPRNTPMPGSIKLDLNASEKVVRPTVLREIAHPYSDNLIPPAKVRCYSFEELFAEKIRAMGERSRPRDLYDIVNLFRRKDLHVHSELIRSVLIEKCKSKGVPIPNLLSIQNSPYLEELKGEWENMLGHQLPKLPPFEQFWNDLPGLFNWLEGKYKPEILNSIRPKQYEQKEDKTWTPPPTIWNWGFGKPLETVRFAAINHLRIKLGYNDSIRTIEPYSLRRTSEGNLLLYAIRVDNQEIMTYRVDRIQSIEVTTMPFNPKYRIEFSPTGFIKTLPLYKKSVYKKSVY